MLDTDLPARAAGLAKRMAVVLETLMAQQKDSREVRVRTEKVASGREVWINRVEELFLEAFEIRRSFEANQESRNAAMAAENCDF